MEKPLPPGGHIEIEGFTKKFYDIDAHEPGSEYGLKIQSLMNMPPGMKSNRIIKRFFDKNEGQDLDHRRS